MAIAMEMPAWDTTLSYNHHVTQASASTPSSKTPLHKAVAISNAISSLNWPGIVIVVVQNCKGTLPANIFAVIHHDKRIPILVLVDAAEERHEIHSRHACISP